MKPIDKDNNSIRLQVFLSHNGIASRRKAMDIIQSGHVSVNGKIIDEPSYQVNLKKDKVSVNGRTIENKKLEYILLHKVAGYVTTKEQKYSASNVFELLPKCYQHLTSVGRLDKDTEGLLLFTNDGDVAYKLTHPKFNIDKSYFVRVSGVLNQKNKNKLINGIIIDGKKTAKAKIIKVVSKSHQTEFILTIHEGRKRQIRLMCDKVGHKVVYLKRIDQGPLKLGALPSGEWRKLTTTEINLIKRIQ